MNEVISTPSVYYSIIPLLVFGAIVLGVLFLILLVILVARGSHVSRTAGGAVALALASVIFLTGVWCFALSPTDKRYETVLNAGPSIAPTKTWTYSASFKEGDVITGNINLRDYWPKPLDGELNRTPVIEPPPDGILGPGVITIPQTFSVFVYDPDGEVVWSEEKVSSSYFTVETAKTGDYRFRVQNDGPNTVTLSINISKTMDYRPLEPFGQWLSLISLPLIGLGIWATSPRRHNGTEAVKTP